MASATSPRTPESPQAIRVFAASSRPRWPAPSSSGTSSSSTPPRRRWSSTRSCSRRRTTRSTPIIAAFVTYAVGFVARPLGGIVFGHFGDKYGRKKLLQVAIVLVGVATFLMGCLPTYAQVGFLAPALLVTLRFAQGFAVGGEWGGAVLLVAEHSPDKSRGFWASFPQAAVPIGNLLATIVLLVLSRTLTEEQFLAWGWRIGFWLSVVIVAIGYYIRTRVTDAPIFLEVQKQVEQRGARALRRARGAQPLPARRLHRDGPALRREHHVLPRRDVLDHLPRGATRSTSPRSSATW